MKARAHQLPNEANVRVLALIRRIKAERNLSQVDLAQALRMTQPALSNLLAGRRGASLTTAQYAAELGGVPLAELLGDVESALKLKPRSYQLSDAANARVIELVRKLRDERQLTQVQLAELLGVPQPAVSNMLSSKGRASYAIARRVADAAGVAIFEIVGDEKAPRGPDAFVGAEEGARERWKQVSDEANQRTIALLRKVKEERGWRLAELAEVLNVTPTHVSLLLNGKRRVSRLVAKSVAETAGVPLRSLLGQRDADLIGVEVTAHELGHGVSGARSEAGHRGGGVAGEQGAANSEALRGLRLNGRLPRHASERTVALIRELVVERGLSQAHLAALIGTTQPAVSALIAGRKQATYQIAKGLADYVGRPVSELLGGHVDGFVAGDSAVRQFAMAMDAVRSMGYAEGYDRAWVTQWVPRGGLGVLHTADELWRLMKADYAKLGARAPRDAYDSEEAVVVIEKLKELLEHFQPPVPSSASLVSPAPATGQARRARRKA